MRKAYENLTSNGRVTELEFNIQTTDLYVRFLPADSLEMVTLMSDTSLIFWDYPLDYEVEVIGHYYHDPSIPENLPTYQYTVVKPDFEFPSISYEVLEELFLPDNYDVENGRLSQDFLDALEFEALRITDNLSEEESNGRVEATSWTPSGTVRVREVIGTRGFFSPVPTVTRFPVKNVKVKGKAWFYLSQTYTDTGGNYKLGTTKREVDYKIEFESDRVKVTDFFGMSRNHNGPNNQRSSWSPTFEWWSESWVNATVLNAAYEMRWQVSRNGIQTPFPTTFWAGSGNALNKLNIRTRYNEGTGDMSTIRTNEIHVYSDFTRGNGHKGTDRLYSLCFHELAHSIHHQLPGWDLMLSNNMIVESWAEYLEWAFTERYYPGVANDRQRDTWDDYVWNKTDGEDREEKDAWEYTALFIDLFDNNAQPSTPTDIRPVDNVSGYSMIQLITALDNVRKLDQLRDYLKNNFNNSTRSNLDDLFEFYIDLEENKKQ